MQFFSIFFALLALSSTLVSASSSGLEYLNTLREQAGLTPLRSHAALQQSAQAHSRYLSLHQISTHLEEEGQEGFTGITASDRAVSAGFESLAVSENVSWGQADIYSSIDKLMGGIYHRFTFLDMKKDLIGIGVEAGNYTYDLGNSFLNLLCQDHEYLSGSYYHNACSDREKRIETTLYDQAQNYYKNTSEAPDMVVWPPKNGTDILPGFYGENPDPLPEYAVSGYPVSVEFNDLLYPESPSEVQIRLIDEEGNALEGMMIDHSNDPAERFSTHQFAFFPLKHLEWGTRYQVTLEFDGERREWCFSTRSLFDLGAQKVYRIDENSPEVLEVVAGRSYALYFVPQGADDQFDRYHYRYNTQNPSIAFLDRNTLLFQVEGEVGQRVELTLNTPEEKVITLIIAQSDQAEEPSKSSCPLSEVSPQDDETSTHLLSTENVDESISAEESESEIETESVEESTGASGGGVLIPALLWSVTFLFLSFYRRERFFRS